MKEAKYTDDESRVMRWAILCSGLLTLAGATTTVATFVSVRRLRQFGRPLVVLVWLAVCDVLRGVTAVGAALVPPRSGPLCSVQGFFIQFSNLAAMGWTLAVSHNLYAVLAHVDLDYSRYFVLYHLIIWPFALIMSLAPVAHYGPAGVWCWIEASAPGFRLAFYLCLMLSFPLLVLVLVRGTLVVTGNRRRATDAAPSLFAMRLRKLYLRISVLIALFFVCWTAAMVNRLLELTGHTSFAAALAQAITDPLQGFFDACVFFAIPIVRNEMVCCGKATAPPLTEHKALLVGDNQTARSRSVLARRLLFGSSPSPNLQTLGPPSAGPTPIRTLNGANVVVTVP
ncbi:uncharacterized protein AMSG_01092 [Thecamonas trahens ATCC 50062]|uniref:G-protein coupled receptors family 2 profile 2 domain-containing protein n=1 Tax=Thecamonas trahens ATCC 50062 TaxID=461836 RepID=A0A0L0DIQ1_THETB|nr:hypothetical protein AMSG_01092 [Thecamonas trahens ATCC 50062]KNC52264.1 hypothetical protein AMSG_01092 [Thecamonas trahens ATCC 50062]|eukprot:XP_013762264.1 hypothetical protein AMSG_01092 [Thecamonas trahens ATCC 50062]